MTDQLSLFPAEIVPKKQIRTAEYFVLISPDDAVKKQVKSFKRLLQKENDIQPINLHSIAHLSLFKIRCSAERDEAVRTILDNALFHERAAMIYINGTGLFDHNNGKETLYLLIHNQGYVHRIREALLEEFGFSNNRFVPHITIARNIDKEKFNRSKKQLQELNYTSSFVCDRITVLKRTISEGKTSSYHSFYESRLTIG